MHSQKDGKAKKVVPNCDKCELFQKHVGIVKEARSSYRDKEERVLSGNEMVVSVERQRVIMLP